MKLIIGLEMIFAVGLLFHFVFHQLTKVSVTTTFPAHEQSWRQLQLCITT